MGLMTNFLSLKEMFRISDQGKPILGVSWSSFHRHWAPGHPLLAKALSLSCSWCWSSWLHTSPDPELSSSIPSWNPLCGKKSSEPNFRDLGSCSSFNWRDSTKCIPEDRFVLGPPIRNPLLPLFWGHLVELHNPICVQPPHKYMSHEIQIPITLLVTMHACKQGDQHCWHTPLWQKLFLS